MIDLALLARVTPPDWLSWPWGAAEWWTAFGFAAQGVFAGRFIVQWLTSEREKRSVIPTAFWYISAVGATMLLTYAIYRRDPVFILGQSTGLFIYLRNLILVHQRQGKRADVFTAMLALLICGLLFFFHLGDRAMWSSGEGRIAQIAREMRHTGDYVLPRFGGRVSTETLTKPPMYHWTVAGLQSTFGESALTVRLPTAMAGLATIIVVYLLARRMFDPPSAFMSVLVLGTNLGFWWAARTARLDCLLAFFVSLAMGSFYMAFAAERRNRLWATVGWAAVGAAMMTKGLGAIVLPVVTLAVFAWLRPQARSLRRFVPWTGVVALVLVAAPWHVRMATKAPPAAVKYYFFGQATRWLTGADREEFFEETPAPGGEADTAAQQAAPPPPGAAEADIEEEAESIAARFFSWFLGLFGYLGTLLMKFFPWVMFLPVAVWLWRRLRPTEAGPALDFLAAWFLGGFVTFSLSATQADRYIVPLYPAAAMLVGVAWARWTEARRGMLIATAAVLATVAAVAVIVLAAGPSGEAGARYISDLFDLNRHDTYAAHFYFDLLGESRVGATIVIALMAALAGACVVLLRRRKVQLAFAMLTLVFVAPMFAFVQFVLPRLDDLYTPAPLAHNVQRLVEDDRTVYGCGKFQPFWRYYIERPATAIPVGGPGGVKEVLDADEPRYVLFWQSEMETIEKYLPEEAAWLKRHAIPLVDDRVDYHEIVLWTNAPGRDLAVARLRRILFEKLTAIREAILEEGAEAIAAGKRAETLANEAAETPIPQPAIESMIEMLGTGTVPSKAAPLPP